MRYKDCQEQQSYLREASSLGNVELVYAGLDVLSSTPWKINKDVFDVVLQVWNSGERLGKIPPAQFDMPEPSKPANYDTDPKAKSIYLTRAKQYVQKRAANHSDRCSINYKIEIARTVSGCAVTVFLLRSLNTATSSLGIRFICRIMSISEGGRIPFRRISITSATI